MNNNDIKNYIEKLKSIETQLSGDSIDSSFMGELDQVLNKLTTEIKDHMNDQSFGLDVKIKKLFENAVIPTYSNVGDAGLDLTVSRIIENTSFTVTYGFGIAIEIPKGHVGLLFSRSSVRKFDIILSNCVGVIDSVYRGEIQSTFKKLNGLDSYNYKVGERAAQLIILPYPTIRFVETDDLTNTARGENGYGSTGL